MKKLALALLFVATLAPSAMATPVQLLAGLYQAGQGGEFEIVLKGSGLDFSGYAAGTTSDLTKPPSFQTFCIEYNEHINLGDNYTATLNPLGAVQGGVAGGDPDQISVGTAWLYSQFARGTLAGYNFSGGAALRKVDAGNLQNAIWMLEQEIAINASNPFWLAAVGHFGATTVDNANPSNNTGAAVSDNSHSDGVFALRMTTTPGASPCTDRGDCQDALIYSPSPVPDGGMTMMLLVGALMGLGALRRTFGA